eukprot:gene15566-17143_t
MADVSALFKKNDIMKKINYRPISLLPAIAKICNYADDTTIYVCDHDPINIIQKLEKDSDELSRWFSNNFLCLNAEKCHLMFFCNPSTTLTIKLNDVQIKESESETLLGVILDKKLNFKKHVEAICTRANQKLHALRRLSVYMSPAQLKIIMESFIKSQFSYCPLIWMFVDRGVNKKINKIHEKALRVVCKGDQSNFEELLSAPDSITIHQRNLQVLMTEIFKTRNGLSPLFMTYVFKERAKNLSVRNRNHLQMPKVRATAYGIEDIRYRGCQLWASLPNEIKESNTLSQFKNRRVKVELPKTYAKDSIPARRNQIPTPDIAEKWVHLRKIKEKILERDDSLDIGLLIGCNCPKAIKPKEIIAGKGGDPHAVRTLLGWCIVGPVNATNTRETEDESNCNRIVAYEVGNDSSICPEFIINERSKEIVNPAAIVKMFERDFTEHIGAPNKSLSKDDRKFLSIVERGIHQTDSGHYEIPLPLKQEKLDMPSNRDLALRRLNQLKRPFESKQGTTYREDYVAFMQDIIDNGYAEPLPPNVGSKDQPKSRQALHKKRNIVDSEFHIRSTWLCCPSLVAREIYFTRTVPPQP